MKVFKVEISVSVHDDNIKLSDLQKILEELLSQLNNPKVRLDTIEVEQIL